MPATDHLDKPLARFRLTSSGNNIDLEVGARLIGRAPECDLIIEDPLASRHHARITCDIGEALFEDLGSRNGSRINGELVAEPRLLEHGDRIQIGSRELIFQKESAFSEVRIPVARRATGSAASDVPEAPAAKSARWAVEEQITLVAWVEPTQDASTRWPLEMLVELLGKAMLAGRYRDVAGIMEQAAMSVDRALDAEEPLALTELDALRDAAHWLSSFQQADSWLRWMAAVYARAGYPRERAGQINKRRKH
ncbi:MAG TPA: FHA domain-containing protein [Polyangiaceae bacterium]|nr:FHA domain-containing protein [Polyangiaceae bacterium]